MRRAIGFAAIVLIAALATFAIPIETWRTGEQRLPPLTFARDGAVPDFPRRLWIDTDAACGDRPRTDPDDCFAIDYAVHPVLATDGAAGRPG